MDGPTSGSAAEQDQVFLSYAREDADLAARVVALLEARGFRVFWDLDIRAGDDWRAKLESKLREVGVVVVLWSGASVGSRWVLLEAAFGHSRSALVPVKIDACALPLSFRDLNTLSMVDWTGDAAPPDADRLLQAVRALIDEAEGARPGAPRAGLVIDRRRSAAAYVSVSDFDAERDLMLDRLIDQSEGVLEAVRDGYRSLAFAQTAALENPDDRAPSPHYRDAAASFREALDGMTEAALGRELEDDRPIRYFLKLERANCLALTDTPLEPAPEASSEALKIYEELLRDWTLADDIPLNFRKGAVLARTATRRYELMEALRAMVNANALAQTASERGAALGSVLSNSRWLVAESARQIGLLNFKLSQIRSFAAERRARYFDEAIRDTETAIATPEPDADPDRHFAFTILKAKANLAFFHAQKLRMEGLGSAPIVSELLAELDQDAQWDVAQNQPAIIDSMTFAAATIGDWARAERYARRLREIFDASNSDAELHAVEREMLIRADEIAFFAGRLGSAVAAETREAPPATGVGGGLWSWWRGRGRG